MSSYDAYGSPGRPDPNCRTCMDFKDWSKQQTRKIYHKNESKDVKEIGDESTKQVRREDCPFDREALGKATWGLLHTMAAFYDDNPTDDLKKDTKTFIETLSRVYPCQHCSSDFQKDLAINPVNVNSQSDFSQWLCRFHNRVNVKLGKPPFDCTKVNERWRDGWLDGSCD